MGKCDNCHWCHIDGAKACKVWDGSGCENWQTETNGDRIRHMNLISLSKLLHKIIEKEMLDDEHLPSCATDPDTDQSQCLSNECFTCPYTILNWLKAPAEQEESYE